MLDYSEQAQIQVVHTTFFVFWSTTPLDKVFVSTGKKQYCFRPTYHIWEDFFCAHTTSNKPVCISLICAWTTKKTSEDVICLDKMNILQKMVVAALAASLSVNLMGVRRGQAQPNVVICTVIIECLLLCNGSVHFCHFESCAFSSFVPDFANTVRVNLCNLQKKTQGF